MLQPKLSANAHQINYVNKRSIHFNLKIIRMTISLNHMPQVVLLSAEKNAKHIQGRIAKSAEVLNNNVLV